MRKITWAVAVLVTILTVSLGTYTVINARTFQLAGHLVSRVDTDARVVALTFDDGPTDHTPEVLELLASRNVPATFYLNGSEAHRHREQVTAIANAGHEIGNHSYSHRRMVFISENAVSDEIEHTDEAILQAGYDGPLTFRPPYGKKLWTLPRYLAARDRVTVMWDVAPDSAGNPDRDAIVEQTVRSVRPGSIVLLHVLVDSRSESRAALPLIIERLNSSGYRFVTVSQLLAMGGGRSCVDLNHSSGCRLVPIHTMNHQENPSCARSAATFGRPGSTTRSPD